MTSHWPFVLFVIVLLAFVVESELTQYIQTTLKYRQPLFIFYIVHSSFAICFPLHLLYLTQTTKYSTSALIRGVLAAITNHLTPGTTRTFPRARFLWMVLLLTGLITYPGLLWFFAISLASLSDVTAIWNANAFIAYLLTFKCRWEPRRLFAVSLATIGVFIVVYGGSISSEDNADAKRANTKPAAPLTGNLMMLVASFGYALYQVLYKKYAALHSDPESEDEYEQLPTDEIPEGGGAEVDDMVYPPPFGLGANLLTSAIGICTLLVLWICIPIFHYTAIEPFVLPNSLAIVATIVGIALTGVVFNAGFMVLLGIWGPIVTSVGNLLTIVFVFVTDIIFGAGVEAVTVGGVTGCALIVGAFGILAFDMLGKRRASQ
ncbi:hypothetical protein MKEN_00820400 [Mycena kentingensis (nom. inval.)]|nr:hypothetical protein MKEN_00820400 [Mycena kentingensis (nom. inval.)]